MNKNNWTYKKFEDCLHKVKYPPKVKTNEYLSLGLFPVVSQEKEYISGYNDDENKVFHHNNPVVIFGDHSREIKYIDFDFIIGADGVKILDVKDFLNPKFFYYNIKWINVESLGYSRHYKLLKENNIPIPPLAEQERIVEELDLLSSIIEKKKAQLKELDQLAQSIFYDMFGDPITNEKGWEVKKLGEISAIGTGATPSREKEELYYGGDIHWVKTTEVHNCVITDTEENITQLAIEQTNCKIYPPNTLLMAMYGQGKTRGQIAKLKISAATNQACAAIMLDNCICNLDFVYELLHIKYDNIRAMAQGGNQANLNMKLVGSIPIILPPLPLQQEFASKVEAIERQKTLIQQSIDEVQTLFDSRMDYWFG